MWQVLVNEVVLILEISSMYVPDGDLISDHSHCACRYLGTCDDLVVCSYSADLMIYKAALTMNDIIKNK